MLYERAHDLEDDVVRLFRIAMREMDSAYLEWREKNRPNG